MSIGLVLQSVTMSEFQHNNIAWHGEKRIHWILRCHDFVLQSLDLIKIFITIYRPLDPATPPGPHQRPPTAHLTLQRPLDLVSAPRGAVPPTLGTTALVHSSHICPSIGTNLGLLNIRFQFILAHRVKMNRKLILKSDRWPMWPVEVQIWNSCPTVPLSYSRHDFTRQVCVLVPG